MKKVYLLLFGLFVAMNLLAQPTITKSDMPEVGDTIWLKTTSVAPGVSFEQTGNNYTWDFSSLVGIPAADTFISVSTTSFTLQLIFAFGSNPANIAQNTADLSFIPNIPLSALTNFYRSSTSAFQLNGFGLGIYGIGLPIKFTGADVWYKFPMTINSPADSSVSTYSQSLLTLGYLKIYRKRVNKVDGWGTLITPSGSFETLRLKSVVHEEDSIYLDTINVGIPIVRNYTEYKWLGNGHGAPLMQVTSEGILSTFRWIDYPGSVNIAEISDPLNLTINPNPARGPVQLMLNANHQSQLSVRIYNMMGQELAELYQGKCDQGRNAITIQIDKSIYPPGLYFLNIVLDGQCMTRKLIVD